MRPMLSLFACLALSMPTLATAQVEIVTAPVAPAAPIETQPAAPASPPIETPQGSEQSDDSDVAGYGGLGMWMEQMNLGSEGLTLSDPEVEALTGVHLDAGWAGNSALAQALVGGVSINVGMRAHEYIRGPELRIMVGGGDIGGDWVQAPGSELELSIQSVALVRLEAALGVQVPLGPVVPYVLGRAAAGGAIIDVGVRHPTLGGLGTEHVDTGVLELGMEAGIGFRLAPGFELGVAFRATFLGAESLGGMLTLGFDGSTIE